MSVRQSVSINLDSPERSRAIAPAAGSLDAIGKAQRGAIDNAASVPVTHDLLL